METQLRKELPPEIFNKIKFNRPVLGLPSSSFSSQIKNNKELLKLDSILEKGCVDQPGIYNISKPDIVDGWHVRIIPKGTNIYKSFQGFVTEDQIKKYNKNDPTRPSWFGNKYGVYAITRTDWNCMVSFKLTKDIVLIDYFDEHNLQKIVDLVNDKDIINTVKMSTGFKMTLSDQIRYLYKTYPKWNEIWIYTKPVLPKKTYIYCNPKKLPKFNPIGAIAMIHAHDIQLFRRVFVKFPKIDGMVRHQIQSGIDEGGVFYHEEFIIKGSSQLDKLKFDRSDPLCWINWKIKDLEIPKDGITISYNSGSKFANTNKLSPNENFKLIKFHSNNKKCLELVPLQKNDKILLSYNLHNFQNLDPNVSNNSNTLNILGLVSKYQNNAEILCFQETSFKTLKDKTYFETELMSMGFKHFIYAKNGDYTFKDTDIDTTLICCFSKNGKFSVVDTTITQKEYAYSIESKKYITPNGASTSEDGLSLNRFENRRQILIESNTIGIVCIVHLSIGVRETTNPTINIPIRFANSNLRILQLTKILLYEPDIIIGDFNFTADDPEAKFLLSKGYQLPTEIQLNEKSTPHNRVDLCFSKKQLGNNVLLKCNYSDHLPMIQTL